MKKSFLALAVIGAFSGAACAQSNVTIYGQADAGFQHLDNGSTSGKTLKVQSGQNGGSRLGFKGTENLTNGLKANFVIEAGLFLDEGTSDQSRTFGRRTTVGLSGDFGTLDFGRDKTTTLKFFDGFDPFESQLINSGAGTRALYYVGGKASAADSTGRTSNAVFYGTPDLSGFSAQASVSLGEQAGNFSAGRALGLTANYKVDGLEVGYNFIRDNAVDTKGINATKAHTVAVAYKFGDIKPVFIYQKQTDDRSTDKKAFTLAASYNVDKELKLIAGFTKVTDDTVAGKGTVGGAKQFALAADYNLSKRTDIYAGYARLTQDSASKLLTATGVSGANVSELVAGVRHKF